MSDPRKYFQGTPEMGDKDNAGDVHIVIDGDERALSPRLDLVNHSPTGFAWNYHGSGPAQLALAMLAYTGSDEWALDHYMEFKREVIALLKPGRWMLGFDFVRGWIRGVQDREGQLTRKNHGDRQ